MKVPSVSVLLAMMIAFIIGCQEVKTHTRLGVLPIAASLNTLPLCGDQLRPRTWSVSVGIDMYKDTNIPTLGGAAHDAWVMHHYFGSPDGGQVPAERRMILLNHQATRANMEFALGRFLAKACPQDSIYLYFAGHGAPEPDRPDDVFLFTYDTSLDNLVGTSLSMRQLPDFLKWRAGKVGKMVMFIDACHSGSINFPKQRGVKFDTPNLEQSASPNPKQKSAEQVEKEKARANALFKQLKNLNRSQPEWSVLTAASGAQVANELSDDSQCPYSMKGYKGGLFTCSILEGLRGGAKVDQKHRMKFSDLHNYVENRVSSFSKGSQQPQWLGSDTSLPALKATIRIPEIPPELLRPPTRETSTLTWTGVGLSSLATAATVTFLGFTYSYWDEVHNFRNGGRSSVSHEQYNNSVKNFDKYADYYKWSAITAGGLALLTGASYIFDQMHEPQSIERHWFSVSPLMK